MAAIPSADVPAARSLATLRRAIDSIDEQIHDLLMQRADVVAEVAQAKLQEGGAAAPVFRAGREAEILRRLVARNRAPLPAELVVKLWREIMVTSSRLQGSLTVAVCNTAGADLAAEHFGAAVLRPVKSVAAVLDAVAKGRAQLGVLPLSGWWPRRPPGVHILAGLPFLRTGAGRSAPEVVVIGRQDFEPSSDDALYVVVTWAKGAKRARRPKLPSTRVLATARRAGALVSLVETTATYAELRAALGDAATVEFLGGYARPIVLPPISSKTRTSKARR